jgi:hypothetical protein
MNGPWHEKHPMPPTPTLAQRAAWHRAHARHCGCRPIPPGLVRQIDELERATSKGRRARESRKRTSEK